ncbi:MAG: pilus assembly protein [Methylococcales bacterium]|nr:pilus assembly protein [Methylococcales bacterium]
MRINFSRKQRGVIAPLVVIALPVLLLAAGWALDFGHVFVNKTRLQNALDATALSAAIVINQDPNKSTTNATSAGIATFNLFKAAAGNAELAGLNAGSLVFEYSKTLNPWGTFNAATDAFAFVRVTSTNMLNVTPVLIRISNLFTNNIPVPAIATAGPVGNNCELMPFLLCADMTKPSGTYFGYVENATYALIQENCQGTGKNQTCQLTAGNYGLLDLLGNQGGGDIRSDLEGKAVNACPYNYKLPLNTKPGQTWGPVSQGIDYRIDTLDTNHNDYPATVTYPPALAVTSNVYAQYQPTGNGQRVIAVPIGDCSTLSKSGNADLTQVGTGCLFINEHASGSSIKAVTATFIKSCEVPGVWNPNNAVLNGPYKIVLFKSPGSGDS